jgi:S-methylmethionine-dependent homocysteine/selenocysteine methylase
MTLYRKSLPQIGNQNFLTIGGIMTTLIFLENINLPGFADFPILCTEEGRRTLARIYRAYLELANQHHVGFILSTPTWRANADWGARLGYDADALADINRSAVGFVEELRNQHAVAGLPVVLNGVIGPRGDGYATGVAMSAEEAATYHRPQIETFRNSAVDLVGASTLTYANEAIGIANAARDARMPVSISFTLGTDGRLPSGQALGSAIEETDEATGAYPAYYMINCVHPQHFEAVLKTSDAWLSRIRGIRANASTKSHAELDGASELDIGDPQDLGSRYASLCEQLPRLNIFGGCCGTDHRHLKAICQACL